jgi:hypothetical protein
MLIVQKCGHAVCKGCSQGVKSCHICKVPIVIWRQVDSDLKANPAVLFGAGVAAEPVPKEVAKTTDV